MQILLSLPHVSSLQICVMLINHLLCVTHIHPVQSCGIVQYIYAARLQVDMKKQAVKRDRQELVKETIFEADIIYI